jgi:zinc protease
MIPNRKLCALLISALAVASGATGLALADSGGAWDIEIPHTRYTLDNGLTLIVHEDPKAPIVAVNVWYHVGSKNEPFGKTGFAHLFEHLMFNGSENYDDDYFKPFDRVGATDMNGTTNFDRTNYFQNVPKNAVDVALWMESDRMGHLLGAVTQDKLDEQRGVVQNEKRQGENQPYGKAFRLIFENTYPAGHPYAHSVIGSLEDLDAASLDDVHEWFKTYYGAANAVIVVAGDVKSEDALKMVERYFGDIPSGPPVERQEARVAKRNTQSRMILEDRVPQSRVYKAWNMPEWGHADPDYLNLVSEILTSGKTSRLYKRLVYEDQIATDVVSFSFGRELGGMFMVWATAQPGQDLAHVEKVLDEEIKRFLEEGPTEPELERVRAGYLADFVRGIERIGGFGGKSDILAQSAVYGGSSDYYRTVLDRMETATVANLHDASRRWLSNGDFVLEVHPFPEYSTVESDVDRSKLPEPTGWPTPKFPERKRATLSNGLDLILAERSAVPVINFQLVVDAGYSADQQGVAGTASLAMNMLDEGTTSRSALEISERMAALGARLGSGSDLDTSYVTMSALKANLDESLEIYADVIMNPAFSQKEFDRLQKQQIAQIQREKKTPIQMALRVFPKLLYNDGHAYGMSFTGSGTEASVESLEPKNLKKFHETWMAPNNATLVIVGDTTLDEITPKLEKLFASWKKRKTPKKNVAEVNHQASQVYIIDRPDSIQSIIFAGHVAPPKANDDEIAIETMNEVLGASFSARINMNLREDKHWSYGARSLLADARGQRPFIVYAPVQSDKTKESMIEIQKELQDIVGNRPPTEDELARAKDKRTLTLPGRWDTANAVANDIVEMVRFGLAEDYWKTFPGEVRGLAVGDVSSAATNVVRPGNVIWVVVGDRAKIEEGIRELNLGDLALIDADGNLVDGDTKLAKK